MTKLFNLWSPSVSQIETANRSKTLEYRNSAHREDLDLFSEQHNVLYFAVKKSSWNKNAERYTPEDDVVKLHSAPPKYEIAQRCFATEIEAASVDVVNEECCVNHGRIGASSVPVPLGNPAPTRLRNESWLLVAVLLHDYDMVFANFGEEPYEVSQTKLSTFTIGKDYIIGMQMFLRRGIDKRADICAVFPVELEIKKRIASSSPSVKHTICAPTKEEVRASIGAQILTEQQKKIDIDSFFE